MISRKQCRLACTLALLMTGIGIGISNGLSLPKKEWPSCTVFKLDHGDGNGNISLGSKKAKRRILNAASKTTKDLAKLSQEHKLIALQIEALDKPQHHAEEMELKLLKRRKLVLKDAIMALKKQIRDSTDNDNQQQKQKDIVVGSGGFADVWLGHQLLLTKQGAVQEKQPVAVKISRSASDNDTLLREAKFIQALEPCPGFVRVQHVEFLDVNHTAVVVLDLLGPSLEDLWWSCTCGAGGLSAPTVLRLADEMLLRLHDMLKFGIVHRDIQPANILMGREGPARRIPHLIDFGISVSTIQDEASSQQSTAAAAAAAVPIQPRHAFSGTPRFASVSALLAHGGGNKPADDLESLCYTLAFLRSGSMPWSEQAEEYAMMNNNNNVGSQALAALKQQIDPTMLCGPDLIKDPAAIAIAAILEHARHCSTPDYNKCRSITRNALTQLGTEARASPPDWEQHCVTWSPDKGILQNTLYTL